MSDASHIIYGVFCPVKEKFIYVGQCKNLKTRIRGHCGDHDGEFRILEKTTPDKKFIREQFWIKNLLENGHPLKNINGTGKGFPSEPMPKLNKTIIPIPLKGRWHRIAAKMSVGGHHELETMPEVRGLCLAIRNCGFKPVFRKLEDEKSWRIWKTK